jgi:maltose alpha-D-glucosyltransferase/alpha-amylase
MSTKRWFAAKGHPVKRIELIDEGEWSGPEGSWLFAFLDVACENIPLQKYFLPLAVGWEEKGEDPIHKFGAWTLAKVRQREKMGILYSAFGDPVFCRALARGIGAGQAVATAGGHLKFSCTAAYAVQAATIDEPVHHPSMDQSNTGVFFGNRLYLKGYQRMAEGLNPEVEIGRFLTDRSPYTHIAPVLGSLEYVRNDGSVVTLALLQQFVENQGSAWGMTLDYLKQLTEKLFAGADTPAPEHEVENPHGYYQTLAETLGQRIGELHQAFAKPSGDPAFDPEPAGNEDYQAWIARVHEDVAHTFEALEQRRTALSETMRAPVEALLATHSQLTGWLDQLSFAGLEIAKTRYHGDLHLGQVLLKEHDFIIIDFEGEPARPLAERRAKHSPLRDVAGMLRSFDYAAATTLGTHPHQPEEKHRALLEALGEWKRQAIDGFLAGYCRAVADCPSIPVNMTQWQQLLNLFLLEKGLYELCYEMDNRPDWLLIPVRGLLSLAATLVP